MKYKSGKIVTNKVWDTNLQNEITVYSIWYNRESMVKKSIQSILSQSFKNYSVVLVDDGSLDATPKLLCEMLSYADEKNIPMAIWFKENEGFVKSLRKAIEKFNDGKFIALHGAGDISKRNRLELQYSVISKQVNIVAVGCGIECVSVEGEIIKKRGGEHKKVIRNNNFDRVPRLGTHGASLYSRNAYNAAGGYRDSFIYSQDTDLYLRLIKQGHFYILPEYLYQKLIADFTVAGFGDWKKNRAQIICSCAAQYISRFEFSEQNKLLAEMSSSKYEDLRFFSRKHPTFDSRMTLFLLWAIKNREYNCIKTTIKDLGIKLYKLPYFFIYYSIQKIRVKFTDD